MVNYQYLYTREMTSHLMRFYSRSLGKSLGVFMIHFYFTVVNLLSFFFTYWVLLQSQCSSSEGRPFRLGTGANMEKVVKMDRDMTKV